jgi:hypothetical protein
MGLYTQVDARWSYYDPNDGWLYHYSNGYNMQFGSASSTWWHFYTTSTSFYMNNPLHVNGKVMRYSQGAFLHYNSSTQANGSITVSTSAASGTPSDGDLWFQRAA